MSEKLLAFRPGMERNAEQQEVDTFVMSSLANFISETGHRPAGAVILWIDEDGSQTMSWCQAEHRDLAFAAAQLLKESTE